MMCVRECLCMHACAWACVCVCNVWEYELRCLWRLEVLDSLELESQVVISHPVWVPGTKLRSHETAVLTLLRHLSCPHVHHLSLHLERTWTRGCPSWVATTCLLYFLPVFLCLCLLPSCLSLSLCFPPSFPSFSPSLSSSVYLQC